MAQSVEHSRWATNIAGYNGQFETSWVRPMGQLIAAPYHKQRIKHVVNYMPVYTMRDIANLTDSRPTPTVGVRNPGEKARRAAMVSESLFSWTWDEVLAQEHLERALWYQTLCGDGFWFVGWNKRAGRVKRRLLADAETGDPLYASQDGSDVSAQQKEGTSVVDPEASERRYETAALAYYGNQQPMLRELREGRSKVTVCSPFEVFPEQGKLLIEDMKEITRATVQSCEEIAAEYGVRVKPEPNVRPAFVQAMSPVFASPALRTNIDEKPQAGSYYAVVYETYWRPGHPLAPAGARFIWTQERVLHVDDRYPYKHGMLPMVQFSMQQLPSRFFSRTYMDDIRPLNMTLCQVITQIVENVQRLGNSPLLVNRNTHFKWKNEGAAEVVKHDGYTPETMPQFLQLPGIPPHVRQFAIDLVEQMREVAGQQEVTPENIPSQLTAATSISQLNETALKSLKIRSRNLERGVQRAGIIMLENEKNYGPRQRQIEISGKDGVQNVMSFLSTEINTALRIEAGSSMPRSVAGKRETAKLVMQMMLNTGRTPTDSQMIKLLEGINMGDIESVFKEFDEEHELIEWEHRNMIETVQTMAPNPETEDMEQHYRRHVLFEKTDAFRLLPLDTQDVLKRHRKATGIMKQILAARQQEQQLRMGIAPDQEASFSSGNKFFSEMGGQGAAGRQGVAGNPGQVSNKPDTETGGEGTIRGGQQPEKAAA